MKRITHFRKIPTLLALTGASLLALAPAAQADQMDDHGFYIGGSYGLVRIDGGDFDDDDNFFQVFGGYQFLPWLGVEASWQDFGKFSNGFAVAEVDSYSLSLMGRLPLTESLALFAKLGSIKTETEIRTPTFRNESDSNDIVFGVGASFEIAENFDFRLAYDWVDYGLDGNDFGNAVSGNFDADLNMFSAGLKLEF